MALTRDQWLQKITNWIPRWWFEQELYPTAVYSAIAGIFAQLDEDVDDQVAATFIDQSVPPILDLLADERNEAPITGEDISVYRARIKLITSQTQKAKIKALVDSLLLTGECQIIEAPVDAPYCSRRAFCSRGAVPLGFRQNYFLILVPPQTHVPYTFASRSYFTSREHFVGSISTLNTVYATIIAAVDKAKAFGVMYGILETN